MSSNAAVVSSTKQTIWQSKFSLQCSSSDRCQKSLKRSQLNWAYSSATTARASGLGFIVLRWAAAWQLPYVACTHSWTLCLRASGNDSLCYWFLACMCGFYPAGVASTLRKVFKYNSLHHKASGHPCSYSSYRCRDANTGHWPHLDIQTYRQSGVVFQSPEPGEGK